MGGSHDQSIKLTVNELIRLLDRLDDKHHATVVGTVNIRLSEELKSVVNAGSLTPAMTAPLSETQKNQLRQMCRNLHQILKC